MGAAHRPALAGRAAVGRGLGREVVNPEGEPPGPLRRVRLSRGRTLPGCTYGGEEAFPRAFIDRNRRGECVYGTDFGASVRPGPDRAGGSTGANRTEINTLGPVVSLPPTPLSPLFGPKPAPGMPVARPGTPRMALECRCGWRGCAACPALRRVLSALPGRRSPRRRSRSPEVRRPCSGSAERSSEDETARPAAYGD